MATNHGKNWVLLAAGSRGWSNYRHQADVCHAYQLFRSNGIPDDNIVVMMYDDIAYHPENPEPGVIINEPNGQNVYRGVPKDYKGHEVTDKNFLAALRGDKRAVGGKKVIQSNRLDTIFVYISDHGGPGVFCFPNTNLHDYELISTVKEMEKKQQFSQMVIYVESCFSGSMLEDLPKNIKVYGTTASSPNQNSYACYYDAKRNAYLADAYSAAWMDHAERHQLSKVTFQDQFRFLRDKVHASSPQQYGNMALSTLPLSSVFETTSLRGGASQVSSTKAPCNLTDLTCSHEVPLKILQSKHQTERDPAKKKALQDKIDRHHKTKACFAKGVEVCKKHCSRCQRAPKDISTQQKEYRAVADHFRETFRDLHDEELEIALSAMHDFLAYIKSGVPVDHLKAGIGVMKTAMENAMK